MISCILLTAGLSKRFGSPKALANINQTIVINHILKNLINTSISQIIILLGHEKQRIENKVFKHESIHLVYNKDFNLGQTSSVQEGLKNCSIETTGFMILPVDCPFINNKTINELIKHFNDALPDILIPVYRNKKGHPPIFNQKIKNSILALDPSDGINSIFKDPSHKIDFFYSLDQGIVQTFNTQEELREILKSKGFI